MLPQIILARHSEDLDWIVENNLQERITIYNRSEPLNIDRINCKNIGNTPSWSREGGAYIQYIIDNYSNLDQYIVFSQANPFDHNEYFVETIKYLDSNGYKDFQPLSCYYNKTNNIPPAHLIETETEDYVGEYPVRLEKCDRNLLPIHYYDNGIFHLVSQYRSLHNLEYNESIVDHFEKIFDISIPTHIIKFAFSAMFGVSKESIYQHDLLFYHKLLDYVNKNLQHGYVVERLWYSILNRT
jgi:hypothetical protein